MANLEHKIDLTLLSQYDFEVDSEYLYKELTCTICDHLITDAYQTYCGCIYCRQCIMKHLNDGHEYCRGGQSDCREEKLVLDYNVFRNPAIGRRILKLRVICPYESCGTIIEHGEMGEHMKDCPQRSIECPYSDIGCDSRMASREKIETHLHTAIFAHSQLVVATINEQRAKFDLSLEDVVNERIKCGEDQKNESIIKTKEMNEIRSKMERDKSESTLIEARRNKEMDALKTEVRRLKEEVKGALVASMALREEAGFMRTRMDAEREEFRGMREDMGRLKADVGCMREELTRFPDSARVAKVEEDLRTLGREGEAEKAESKKMRVRLSREQRCIKRWGETRVAKMEEDLRTFRREGEAERAESRNMRGEVESLKEEVKRVIENNARLGTRNKMIECAEFAAIVGTELARSIDSLSIWREREGAMGELWFSVDNVAQRTAIGGRVDSPHFYSHANGYKLRMRVYPVKGSECMHVTSVVCKGECDDVLSWPCRFTLSVAVVHKHTKQPYETQIITYGSDTDNRYSKKPIGTDNRPHGSLSFLSNSDIHYTGATVDDSLFFHVVVGR